MNPSQIWSIDSELPVLEDPISAYMNNRSLLQEPKDQSQAHVSQSLNSSTISRIHTEVNSVPRLVIRLPVLEFIKEACQALKLASDQVLRPKPTIGFDASYSREVDLTGLLDKLEKNEKKLDLIADSGAGLDAISNVSRVVALNCYGLIRSLRKDLICGKQDPAHPNSEDIPNLINNLDGICIRLQAERIKLEDVLIKIVLQQKLPDDFDSDAA